jgi:hypothetical protein
MTMDELTRDMLRNIIQALQALTRAIDKSIDFGMYEGAEDTIVKQYRGLYHRVTQLLPEDTYLTEFLGLNAANGTDKQHNIMQVKILSEQLLLYVQGLVRVQNRQADEQTSGIELELQKEILRNTRQTIRRAISGAENEFPAEDDQR